MIIDNIPDIQDIIKESDSYNFDIELIGTPVHERYPEIKISIDSQTVWSGQIRSDTFLKFNSVIIDGPVVNLEIDYYNKLDNDTIVDKTGLIIANQSVKLNSLKINDLLISGTWLSEYSNTTYRLTEEQKSAYNSNSFPWKNVKTDVLWNNGSWTLTLQKPIIAGFLKQKSISRQAFELSHLDILSKLQNYFRE